MSTENVLTEADHTERRPSSRIGLRLFLIDDHTVVREGLRRLIDHEHDMQVVGEAADGREAQSTILAAQPDLVVLDISMPRLNGVDMASWLRSALPHVPILALTMHEDKTYLREMLQAGVTGYILKRSCSEDLLHAVRQAAAGKVYIDPALGSLVIETLIGTRKLRGESVGTRLSEREEEVLRRLSQGFANKEIAAQLSIGVKTVETYKNRGMEKLEIDGRAGLVRYALQQGWLQKE